MKPLQYTLAQVQELQTMYALAIKETQVLRVQRDHLRVALLNLVLMAEMEVNPKTPTLIEAREALNSIKPS